MAFKIKKPARAACSLLATQSRHRTLHGRFQPRHDQEIPHRDALDAGRPVTAGTAGRDRESRFITRPSGCKAGVDDHDAIALGE
jgi:hypothetical protein